MLPINCLIQNTKLLNDVTDYVNQMMLSRIGDGKGVSFTEVFYAVKKDFPDLDMQTVATMYKANSPSLALRVGNGVLDSDTEIDKVTGKAINKALKKIVYKRGENKTQTVGNQKPSASIATDILNMFQSDFIGVQDNVTKTVMREIQDAVKKSASALIEKSGANAKVPRSMEEILNEALRVDKLAVTDINGQLNTIDNLFDQVVDEIDDIVNKLEKSKPYLSQARQNEVDLHIQQLRAYTQNIVQGAYTLALSKAEAKKVLMDLLKEKYNKTLNVNGAQKVVLDINKAIENSANFERDAADVLSRKGYTPDQVDKIVKALEFQFEALKTTSQWANIASSGVNKAINDDIFLSRVASNVIMSKVGKNGKEYKIYDKKMDVDIPDIERWEKDNNTTYDALKDEIKADLKAKGSASQYRRITSELARLNNPSKSVSKSDLEKLSEMQKMYGFDPKFNAKVYRMLGIEEDDVEAGKAVEELAKKVSSVTSLAGNEAKIAMGKLLDNINSIMIKTQGKKNKYLAFARWLENAMGNRNAYRLLSPVNVVENTLSGVSQIIQSSFMTDKEAAKKELANMFVIMRDVATGGKHFDVADSENLSFISHDYRFDPNKSLSHNMKAVMSILPNVALGVFDSAAHSFVMRTTFYNSAVLVRESALRNNKKAELVRQGVPDDKIEKILKSQKKEFHKRAVDDVANTLYDPTAENEALAQAEQVLKLVEDNPTQAEIRREAANLMFNNMVKADILSNEQMQALKKAADITAKKAIGKESSTVVSRLGNIGGLADSQRRFRDDIRKDLQNKEYSNAATKIIWNAVLSKGLFPFIKGAANWTEIGIKKAGAGVLYARPYNKKSFRKQIEDVSELDPKKMGELLEKNATMRNEMYFAAQGLAFAILSFLALAAYFKATGDDDDDLSVFEMFNQHMRDATKSKRNKSYATRWLPPMLHVYNLLNSNIKDNPVRLATQFTGLDVMESPLTKGMKYVGKDTEKAMTAGAVTVGGVFDVGAYYGWANSWIDAFSKEQTTKATPSNWYEPLNESPTISGLLYGMAGYRLAQDVKNWTSGSDWESED